jgi:hypothetical protein
MIREIVAAGVLVGAAAACTPSTPETPPATETTAPTTSYEREACGQATSIGKVALVNKENKTFKLTEPRYPEKCLNEEPVTVFAYDGTFMTEQEHSVASLAVGTEFTVACFEQRPAILGLSTGPKGEQVSGVALVEPDVQTYIKSQVGSLQVCSPVFTSAPMPVSPTK